MKFTKMHGIGNDYIYVNCFEETVEHPQETAKFVSDRHFGVGSDGLILIRPSGQADFEMAMYNADGSRGEMCGNAIRCVAKYVYDHHMTDRTKIRIETLAGVKETELLVSEPKISMVRVNMGKPELRPEKIPVIIPGAGPQTELVSYPVTAGGLQYAMTCVSMGNPHCVIFTDDVMGMELSKTGPQFEYHPYFPNRINTEFVKVLDRHTIQMRVWERGSGETLACGTGACAATVACILNGLTERVVTVKLLGGDLNIEWDKDTDTVYMTGPAEYVFEGEVLCEEEWNRVSD